MIKRYLIFLLILLLAACQGDSTPSAPTVIAFPTVTPGQSLVGLLSTPDLSARGLSNPATAAALAAQPTPTPDTRTCPQSTEVTLPEDAPTSERQITGAIINFLSAGGTVGNLQRTLEDDWGILAYLRSDLDLTGDNTSEVIIGYSAPESGVLLIAGCLEGAYVNRYETTSDELDAPDVLLFDDVNRDQRPDVLFTTRICEDDVCRYRTQLITWRSDLGRFVSLLGTEIISDEQPQVLDFDNDEVIELVIRQDNRGNLTTGPLRTGINIYDWDGDVYVLSVVRPDPPRFRIQLVHEADRYFSEFNMIEATNLYQQAVSDDSLRNWLDDEEADLRAYVFYRLLVARAYEGDGAEQLQTILSRIEEAYPDPAATPVYVEMSRIFLNVYQASGDNLTPACDAVLNLVAAQPQAVDLLNRYGNRSPTYIAQELCPFA